MATPRYFDLMSCNDMISSFSDHDGSRTSRAMRQRDAALLALAGGLLLAAALAFGLWRCLSWYRLSRSRATNLKALADIELEFAAHDDDGDDHLL